LEPTVVFFSPPQTNQLYVFKEGEGQTYFHLKAFKKEARSQMQSHREAIISFCEEADDFQKVSLADLAQVREVMQSMLEIRRSTQKRGRRRRGFQI
jgi:hypothetical protein